jgi:hypothetical protein
MLSNEEEKRLRECECGALAPQADMLFCEDCWIVICPECAMLEPSGLGVFCPDCVPAEPEEKSDGVERC